MALINERLRRKRGKALPQEEAKEYQGGARFMDHEKAKEYCKPRTTSHDCRAVMTNASDYFRA